jgi:hypothetical protein
MKIIDLETGLEFPLRPHLNLVGLKEICNIRVAKPDPGKNIPQTYGLESQVLRRLQCVSPLHAVLQFSGGYVHITPLSDVYKDGQLVTRRTPLQPGDEFSLGESKYRMKLERD